MVIYVRFPKACFSGFASFQKFLLGGALFQDAHLGDFGGAFLGKFLQGFVELVHLGIDFQGDIVDAQKLDSSEGPDAGKGDIAHAELERFAKVHLHRV
ncbi:MAG: hypothetical protein UY41_C0022G0011 [Candidatus Moranbacteria bacterium GW2011_GWE1_49_15]|nr:MAG: hypothetical protein UY41_C0022G0011 [Candidatus Moranbacteria bacterium GW2011_GWE1_49_15]